MSQQPQFPRRPATIFNDFKYDMPKSTKPVDGARFPATWTWEIGVNGKIHFKVNDGIYGQQDANAKNKEVELSWLQRGQLLFVLQEAVNNKDFETSQVVISKKLYNNSTKRFNDTPTVMATFTIIRTKTGEIRVNFARGTYELMFVFNDDKLIIRTKTADGTIENVGLASRAYTNSFIAFSTKFLDHEEWARYTREDKKAGGAGGQGGGQGGGNNTQGGGGGGQSSGRDFDDEDMDMDF